MYFICTFTFYMERHQQETRRQRNVRERTNNFANVSNEKPEWTSASNSSTIDKTALLFYLLATEAFCFDFCTILFVGGVFFLLYSFVRIWFMYNALLEQPFTSSQCAAISIAERLYRFLLLCNFIIVSQGPYRLWVLYILANEGFDQQRQ